MDPQRATCNPNFWEAAKCRLVGRGIECDADCRAMQRNCRTQSTPIEPGWPQVVALHGEGDVVQAGRPRGFMDAVNHGSEEVSVQVRHHPTPSSNIALNAVAGGPLIFGQPAAFSFFGRSALWYDGPGRRARCFRGNGWPGVNPEQTCMFAQSFIPISDLIPSGQPVTWDDPFLLAAADNLSGPFRFLSWQRGKWRLQTRDRADRFTITANGRAAAPRNSGCVFRPLGWAATTPGWVRTEPSAPQVRLRGSPFWL